MTIQIADTIALVTGANRGIGRALVEALIERGAAKVYATARRPEALASGATTREQHPIRPRIPTARLAPSGVTVSGT